MPFFGLRCRGAVGKIVGNLSGKKLVTSLSASWKFPGNSKLLSFEVPSPRTSEEKHGFLCCNKL